MIVSKYGFNDMLSNPAIGLDPSRVASQVVSGIGFLGAGTIILEKHYVKGLTTAAGIWATSGIGLAAGAGLYNISILSTILVVCGIEILNFISGRIISKSFDLDILATNKSIYNIQNVIEEFGFNISGISLQKTLYNNQEAYSAKIKIKVKGNRKDGILPLIHQLNEQENIIKIDVESL